MTPELFWTKVAALGQVAGAAATFLATGVALWLTQSERRYRLRVHARFGLIVDGNSRTEVMTLQVDNIGLRKVTISGFGWTTGWSNSIRFLPKILRLKSIYQMPDYEWAINKNMPWTLEAGESGMTHMRRADFIEGMTEQHPLGLYRRFPFGRSDQLIRFRSYVQMPTRENVYFGTVDRKIADALEARYSERLAQVNN